MAYARLGTNYRNLGETARAAENTRKAYELRERLSDARSFTSLRTMRQFVTGNLEAARKTYELWAQTLPARRQFPVNNLAVIYQALGDHDKSLAAIQEA